MRYCHQIYETESYIIQIRFYQLNQLPLECIPHFAHNKNNLKTFFLLDCVYRINFCLRTIQYQTLVKKHFHEYNHATFIVLCAWHYIPLFAIICVHNEFIRYITSINHRQHGTWKNFLRLCHWRPGLPFYQDPVNF